MKNATFPAQTIAVDDALVLEPIARWHTNACFKACQDPDIQSWMTLPDPYTLATAEAWCSREAEGFRAGGRGIHYAICESGQLQGSISFKNARWKEDVVELGFWLAASARGQGLATRAIHATSNYAFAQGFQRVEMRIADSNAPAIAAAERAGFVREGLLRMAGVRDGSRIDLTMYSLVMSDAFR